MNLYERFKSAANEIRRKIPLNSKRAFVLGNRIQPYINFNSEKLITYSSLSGLKDIGIIGGGFYPGYTDSSLIMMIPPLFEDDLKIDVRLKSVGVRILQILGIEDIFIFGIGERIEINDNEEVMFWAEDHINLSGINPLVGTNIDEFGARFPDMTNVYDNELTMTGRRESEKSGFKVDTGIWAACSSDMKTLDEYSDELTKSSVNYYCDELICESIAAAHGKINLGLSLLVNPSDGAAEKFVRLIRQLNFKSN